jgi:lysophospholipid acyltransferase (LPLAT)-like uncharacterized protein
MVAGRQTPQVELKPALSFKDRALARLASWLGWLVLQAIVLTSRVKREDSPGYLELLASGKPHIYAFWHRYQLLLSYVHGGHRVNVLVSRSRDGEFIAATLHLFGYKTIRGSSSRGGAGALLEIIKRLKEGESAAFTPDGPRGPFKTVHPGIVSAARSTGVPVVPLSWAGTRVKELSSWDRFLIPLPFGRYHVIYGNPVWLSADGEDGAREVHQALEAVTEAAASRLSEWAPPSSSGAPN